MNDSELARDYILDRLTEEDRDACERRFLFDPDFEEVMHEQERALLDAYVHSRLEPEEADAVLRRVAQQPGHLYRLRFAEGLKRAAAAGAIAGQRKPARMADRIRSFFEARRPVWLGGLAAAGALAIAIVVAVSVAPKRTASVANSAPSAPVSSSNVPAQTASSAASEPAKPVPQQRESKRAPALIATFVLLANQQRGEGNAESITLPAGATTLRLQLTTEGGLDAGRYNATLFDAQDTTVLHAGNLVPRTTAGRSYIDLRVPSDRIPAGAYRIELRRASADEAAPALSFRFSIAAGSAE
jgi:hypothetical protein